MGVVRWYEGNYPDAEHYHELALRAWEARQRKGDMAASHHNLGLVYDDQGKFTEAMEQYLQAMRLYEELRDEEGVAQEHAMVAVIHFNQKNYQEALAENELARTIRERIGDEWGLSETYSNMGVCYAEMEDYAKAMKYYDMAARLRTGMEDLHGLAISYNNYADIYRKQGRYADALASLDTAYAINERLGYKKSMADVLLSKAKVYAAQGELHKALNAQLRSLKMSEELGATDHVQIILDHLSKTSASLGDHESAYRYRLRYEALTDSLFNQQKTRSLVQQQMRYEFGKQAFADSLLHANELGMKQQEIRRGKLVRDGFIVGFALMVAFATVFFFQRNRIGKEKRRGDELLHNILPDEVAAELKMKGEAEARQIEQVTVLFTDFKGFTTMAESMSPKALVKDIHDCFSAFDRIMEKHGIEKIKTIGDAYMAAGGLPTPNTTHAVDVVRAALDIQRFMHADIERKRAAGLPYFEVRIGVHTGPVVAGIVGVKKFQYDIWGDTVNIASRMESSGEPGRVNISESTQALLTNTPGLRFTARGKVQAKGKGELEMYFVEAVEETSAV